MNAPARFDVSVVIPLYNKAAYVRAALESVLAQCQPAREVLVIDDGSADAGPAIVESFGAKQVRLIRQANSGPGVARNRGIEEAKSPWIAFLDADDLWLPGHLAHLAELNRAFPNAAVLASGYEEFRGKQPAPRDRPSEAAREIDFFALDPAEPGLSSSSVAVKRDALRAAGGFARVFPGEDVDLWIRLGLGNPVILSRKITALYRREDEGLTHEYLTAPSARELPIFETLDSMLSNPIYGIRHAAISRYRDRWLLLLARQAIGRGQSAAARPLLRKVTGWDSEKAILTALAVLPARLSEKVLDVRRITKGLRGQHQ